MKWKKNCHGELYASVGKAFRHVSNVAGVRHLTKFPYWILKRVKPAENDDREQVKTGEIESP